MRSFQVETLTLGERMQLALRRSPYSGGEMAAYLGVSRNAVSDWLHDRSLPKLSVLRLWSAHTDAELGWLLEAPGADQAYRLSRAADRFPDLRTATYDPTFTGDDLCAVRDSNPEPAG